MLALVFTFSCSSDKKDDDVIVNATCPDAATSSGTVSCGGQTYRTVLIGNQTWMAENINYRASGRKCYDNKESNCNTYGRLYDWEAAMAVCPNGWHLPSNDERDELINFVQNISGNEYSISELKATEGWNENDNGTDEHGFSALPGGKFNSYGSYGGDNFNGVGDSGSWWTASWNDNYNAYSWVIGNGYYGVNVPASKRLNMLSVRCVKNGAARS